jgi:PAS domain S-box-containing protein
MIRALFNNDAIGIIAANMKGEVILINPFALKQFGYTDEKELLGKKIEVLIPSRFHSRHIDHRDHYHADKERSRPMGTGMDLYGVKKDGTEFPVEVSLSPFKNEGEHAVIAFISDITIRKESVNALKTLNAGLERKVEERTQSLMEALEKEKELNELKSRFVSMASHEFRTPLSTILSSAYLVSQYTSTDDQPKRDKHLQRIISSVNLLTDILNDFLSVGKIEEGKISVRFASVEIPHLVNELVGEIQPILKTGQNLLYKHTGQNEAILDMTLLKHIVINLVSNAIKFSPEGGIINIATDISAGTFTLSVKDGGIGISEEDRVHLFERFFRGANAINIQGTGLGLNIVSKYVELMNGNITCDSELNKGTHFTIVFDLKNHHHEEENSHY